MLEEEQLVYWHSGLYLQPQHFQSIDLHHSFMLARHRQLSQPYHQGYYECNISDELLKEFTIRIDKMKAVLSSGYYLEYPGNCEVQDKCLSHLRNSDKKSVNLWLALKRFNSVHTNVATLSNKRGSTRWVSSDDEEIMRNVYHESPETGITRIKYDVRIITDEEKENCTDCELLPLTSIIYDKNSIQIDLKHSFPALRLSTNKMLKKLSTEIYSEVCYYKNKLEQYKYSEHLATDGHLFNFLILCAINRTLPLLAFFINESTVHPWIYYMTLYQLASEIGTFNHHDASIFEKKDLTYNHFEQKQCFCNIQNYLKILLENLCKDKIISLEFKYYTSDMLICNLDEGSEIKYLDCFIKLTSNVFKNKSTNTTKITEIKLAPAGHIDLIIQHALPGISLTEIDANAAGLLKHENIIWLKIDRYSELWRKAHIQKQIAFYWSYSPDDLLVELVLSPNSEM